MAQAGRDDLHTELARLRAENDSLRAELTDLKAALAGTAASLAGRCGFTRTQSRIVAVLMSGRSYLWWQIAEGCGATWTEGSIRVFVAQLRRHPLVEIPRLRTYGAGWRLTPQSIARLKASAQD